MRIGIDIDDVLYPWYLTAHMLSEAAGITNGVTPTTWRCYEDYGCTDQEWFDVLADATLSGDLYTAPPIGDTVEQLQRLRDAGHTIHLVTARGFMQHGEAIRLLTVEWLAAWDIPHDSLTFTRDKRVVVTDVFLDDASHNYDELTAAGRKAWLLHAPHNAEHRDGRLCVETLGEFVDAVLGGDPS